MKLGPIPKLNGIKDFQKFGQITLKMGPKVTYLKLIVLKPSVLGQNFKDLAHKITYLNRDLGSLKPSKFWNCVHYQILMV